MMNLYPRQMIYCILSHRRKITDTLKKYNNKAFYDEYDPIRLINVYFIRIEETIQLADDINLQFTTKNIMIQSTFQM